MNHDHRCYEMVICVAFTGLKERQYFWFVVSCSIALVIPHSNDEVPSQQHIDFSACVPKEREASGL